MGRVRCVDDVALGGEVMDMKKVGTLKKGQVFKDVYGLKWQVVSMNKYWVGKEIGDWVPARSVEYPSITFFNPEDEVEVLDDKA